MELSIYNLLKCGFFAESLPQRVFSTAAISDYLINNSELITKIEDDLKNKKIISTPCTLISSYKNDLERRIIAIPHIETYISLLKETERNKDVILNIFESNNNSYSKTIRPFEILNYEIKSLFYKNYIDRTKYALGYKYLLKVDLSKCYENIYTHSLTWALMGKESAKNEFRKKPNDRSTIYKTYDQFDSKLRAINNNETKGIPTGPISSRIVSELILTEIDKQLEHDLGCHYKRYVDDYNFYFRSSTEAEEFLPKFQNILYEYKLHINSSKTEILKYPYSVKHNLNNELGKYDFRKNGYLDFIEKFIELYLLGNKGALKFGLKVLKSKQIPNREKDVVFSHLINIMVTYPNLAEYIFSILIKNDYVFDESTSILLNEILKSCLKNTHQLESIWLLSVMLEFNIELSIENIVEVLDSREVFSTILVLDYINKHNLKDVSNVKESIENLRTYLKNENIYGEKWLLIYEINHNNWMNGLKGILNSSSFLKNAFLNQISFYHSPFNHQ